MSIIKANDDEFKKQISENELVIAKFYADWCGTCKLFQPKYRKMSENPDYEDVVFLDIDAENNPEARKTAGVDNLPFFATFRKGELVNADFTAKEEGVIKMIEALKNN